VSAVTDRDELERDEAHVQRLRELREAKQIISDLVTVIDSRWSTSTNRPPSAFYRAIKWLDRTHDWDERRCS